MGHKIEKRSQENTIGFATKKWAIFELGSFDFYGFDYNEKYVILVNYDGEFVIGHKYANCISIGSVAPRTFSTFSEAAEYCDKSI